MRRFPADGVFQLRGLRQCHAVFRDELAQGPPVANSGHARREQGDVDVAARLVPRAEAAVGDAVADAFRGAAQPGIFPVVDRAGAVGGQVREPTLGHQGLEDPRGPVPQKVRAVDEHHRGAAAAGRADLGRQVVQRGRQSRVQRTWRGGRIDEDLLHARKALPLGQRIDLDLTEIQGRARPGHAVSPSLLCRPVWLPHAERVGMCLCRQPAAVRACQAAQQDLGVAIVGNHDVRADAQEPLPLPGIHPSGAVVRLVAGHGDGQSAHGLGVLDLHVAVAEGQQPLARDGVVAEDAIDDHLLGEVLIVVLRPVDPRAEVAGHVEQLGLGLDARLVGAAGQVEREAPGRKPLQELPAAVDQQLVGPDASASQSLDPVADPLVEAAEILVLVPQRLPRAAAALGDPLGQLDHLENRLLAVQPHDVVVGQPAEIGVGLAARAGQHLDEHRRHHFRPTLADQRQGAVEIEQDVTDLRPGTEPRTELDKAGKAAAISSQTRSWQILSKLDHQARAIIPPAVETDTNPTRKREP